MKRKILFIVGSHNQTLQMHKIAKTLPDYDCCGFGNIFIFSLALKKLPTSTDFAVWTVLIIILLKCADLFFFKNKIQLSEAFFLMLITVGIIGLKYNSGE